MTDDRKAVLIVLLQGRLHVYVFFFSSSFLFLCVRFAAFPSDFRLRGLPFTHIYICIYLVSYLTCPAPLYSDRHALRGCPVFSRRASGSCDLSPANSFRLSSLRCFSFSRDFLTSFLCGGFVLASLRLALFHLFYSDVPVSLLRYT